VDHRDAEQLIQDALSDPGPNTAMRHHLKGESSRALARGRALRLRYRRAAAIGLVTLTAAGAFLVGRCTPAGRDSDQRAVQAERVVVSRDLVTWLEAGRFFAQLGMPEREARAYQQAIRLAEAADQPTPLVQASTPLGQLLARCDTAAREQTYQMEHAVNRIMAQVSGGFDYGR